MSSPHATACRLVAHRHRQCRVGAPQNREMEIWYGNDLGKGGGACVTEFKGGTAEIFRVCIFLALSRELSACQDWGERKEEKERTC